MLKGVAIGIFILALLTIAGVFPPVAVLLAGLGTTFLFLIFGG